MEENGMKLDWQSLHRGRPKLVSWMAALKRQRTKVGFALAAVCVAESIYFREQPFHLHQFNVPVLLSFVLIGVGLLLRIGALMYLRKKESLATNGVYSLCRHPLYLGSILLAYGFCVLLNDLDNFVVATVYFFIFYSLTIVWEESRLAERYGETHRRYRGKTPLIAPFGRYQANDFQWRYLKKRSVLSLLMAVVGLLLAVEIMGEMLSADSVPRE
jgi:protein-S-isoprenylcysteine O-methyltransferase Ste14